MSGPLDALLVGSVVLGAVLYAFRALAPRAWRTQLGRSLATRGWTRLAGWLAPGGTAASGSCGGCDNCASSATPGSPAAGAAAETRISVDSIGRRVQ